MMCSIPGLANTDKSRHALRDDCAAAAVDLQAAGRNPPVV